MADSSDTHRCLHCGTSLVWSGEWYVWRCPNGHDNPLDDGDIGKCDDCGTDEGERVHSIRTVTLQGKPEQIAVYLCESCASG